MTHSDAKVELTALADRLNEERTKMKELIAAFDPLITRIVNAIEDQIMPAADEKDNGSGKVIQKVTYKTKEPSPADIASFTSPSGRHCSNCGEAGHTARTCSNERKEEPEEKPVKVKRKLSPERKAQLIETLKKARAAKGKVK
jgi:hypothetical protein